MKSHGNWRTVTREWMTRYGWATLGAWLALGPTAAKAADEYNFSWLDPDKKIYVLQNRRYLKGNRPLLSAMIGTGFSNPYRTVFTIDPRLAYYMNETWGVEVMYQIGTNKVNGTADALKQSSPNSPP